MEIVQLPTKSCYLDIYNYPLKETIILPWSFGHLLLPSSRIKILIGKLNIPVP